MTRTSRVLLTAWLCQPLYLVAELLVAGLATDRYSLRRDTISALGVGCPPGGSGGCSSAPTVMNSAFVVFGLLMALGAGAGVGWLAAGGAAPGRRHRVLIALWVLAGLSSVAVGLVPLSRGEGPHAVAATPVFAVQPVAMLLGAALLPREPAGGGWRRWARPVALGLGVLAAVGTVAFVLPLGDPDWSGAAERVALWPAKLWLALVAALAWHPRRGGQRGLSRS